MASSVPIKSDSPRVLRREEFDTAKISEQILVTAKIEAQEIINRAQQEAEEEKKRGFAEGKADGENKAAIQIVEIVGQSIEYLSKIEEALIDVVMDALRKIIGEFDQQQLVARIVNNAMTYLISQQKVTLRVHPEEAKSLGKNLDALARDSSVKVQFIDIVPDARLRHGSAILESEAGIINADIHRQIHAIETALRTSLRRPDKAPPEQKSRELKNREQKAPEEKTPRTKTPRTKTPRTKTPRTTKQAKT